MNTHMDTEHKDINNIDIKIGDILSLGGETNFETTLCGEIIKYKGKIVCFYGQDVLGRDCYDELDTINTTREVIGNIDSWDFNE